MMSYPEFLDRMKIAEPMHEDYKKFCEQKGNTPKSFADFKGFLATMICAQQLREDVLSWNEQHQEEFFEALRNVYGVEK
jgi:hypothetical protein